MTTFGRVICLGDPLGDILAIKSPICCTVIHEFETQIPSSNSYCCSYQSLNFEFVTISMRQCSSFNRSIEVFLRNWFEDDLCSVMTVETFIVAEINAEMIFLQARILQNLAPRSCYYDGVLSRFAMSSKNCLLSEEAIFVVSNLMHLASCFSARWQRQLNESSCVSKYDTWLFATFFLLDSKFGILKFLSLAVDCSLSNVSRISTACQ